MTDSTSEHQAAVAHRSVVERLWTGPVFDACIRGVRVPSASSVLIAESRCGLIPEKLLEEIPEDTRIISLDPSRAMLDQARSRMDDAAQRRIFFVPQKVSALSYADDVFRASICANGVVTPSQAEEALSELVRVTQPGGTIVLAAPLQTSFPEFYDMLDEALRAHRLHDVLTRMYDLRTNLLSAGRIAEIAESKGLHDVEFEELTWDVAFGSGQELLSSPLVRETFYPLWLGIIRSSDREPILRYIVDAIDTYWHSETFTCRLVAGCLKSIL